MRYFISDTHLGDPRLGIEQGKPNVFFRPFTSIMQENTEILLSILNTLKEGDELWHVGDVIVDNKYEFLLKIMKESLPNVKMNLIIGNYDDDKLEMLSKYFDNIVIDETIEIEGKKIYLNHYPINCKKKLDSDLNIVFCICGHVHSLWKIQPKMINVSIECWNYKPVSEEEIKFIIKAHNEHYDNNVFPYIK